MAYRLCHIASRYYLRQINFTKLIILVLVDPYIVSVEKILIEELR